MNWFNKRSSLASGLATGVVGWNGFVVLTALLLGWRGTPWVLLGLATVTAVVQVAVLWPAFYLRLRCDDGAVLRGATWGALTGPVAFAPWVLGVEALSAHRLAWTATALYIGGAVGAFLAYFFRDDARLLGEGAAPDEGRDSHWLEPFGFGAIVFTLVCLPHSVDAALYTLMVGAVTGVVAAGLSHFSPDAWKRSLLRVAAFCAVGAALGGVGSFLLRHQLVPVASAVSAGALTLLVTILRGQALAAEERG
jgi:hypothetical protein